LFLLQFAIALKIFRAAIHSDFAGLGLKLTTTEYPEESPLTTVEYKVSLLLMFAVCLIFQFLFGNGKQ
jgi:hypothetical protein